MSDLCDCGHTKVMHSGCTSWCMSICGCTAYRNLRDMPLCECGHEAALHPMIASYRSRCHAACGCSCQQYRQLTPTVVQQLVTDSVGIIMCDQCLTPHPRAFCPKRITADQENELGKKKDDWDKLSEWDRMRREIADLGERLTQRENAHRNLHASLEATDREVYGLRDFAHRANVEANKRLDDLTGRMGAREDAAHNLVEALDDVNKSLDTTDECVAVLKDTVATLADCVENLNRAQESTTATLKTQHHLTQRLHKRVGGLEDKEPHGIGLDGHCADCDENPESIVPETESCPNCDDRKCLACVYRQPHPECEDDCPSCCGTKRPQISVPVDEPSQVISNQDRLDLIGRWMHPGLWSAMDGRREAILKILAGLHVEPPLAGGGGRR